MARLALPPGFRFHPTEEEIVGYYLKRKVFGQKTTFEAIADIDLYKFEPWDLPEMSCLQTRDLEWYFYCVKDRKYQSGGRASRTTELGYWKATGKDRTVLSSGRSIGMKKTLVYYKGRAPKGERTNWVMHEYRLHDGEFEKCNGLVENDYVLCRIFKKSGVGPKTGEQYGAPMDESDWALDCFDATLVSIGPSLAPRLLQSAECHIKQEPGLSEEKCLEEVCKNDDHVSKEFGDSSRIEEHNLKEEITSGEVGENADPKVECDATKSPSCYSKGHALEEVSRTNCCDGNAVLAETNFERTTHGIESDKKPVQCSSEASRSDCGVDNVVSENREKSKYASQVFQMEKNHATCSTEDTRSDCCVDNIVSETRENIKYAVQFSQPEKNHVVCSTNQQYDDSKEHISLNLDRCEEKLSFTIRIYATSRLPNPEDGQLGSSQKDYKELPALQMKTL